MASLGTHLYTLFFGRYVGSDDYGNRYYRSSKCQGKHVGRANTERRWVVYKGEVEPSKVPAEWHGWLHHITDEKPSNAETAKYSWQKPHKVNCTGTHQAYLPQGHKKAKNKRAKATGDYNAWKPNS